MTYDLREIKGEPDLYQKMKKEKERQKTCKKKSDYMECIAFLRGVLELLISKMTEAAIPGFRGTLFEKIEALSDKGCISPAMTGKAHTIRMITNEAVHSGNIQDIRKDSLEKKKVHELKKLLSELQADLEDMAVFYVRDFHAKKRRGAQKKRSRFPDPLIMAFFAILIFALIALWLTNLL